MNGLRGDALKAATELLNAYPSAIITSGLRGLNDQARAMANNIVSDRNYVRRTHVSSKASNLCQLWVDAHLSASRDDTEKGILLVLSKLPVNELAKLSKHLSGDAFDVKPLGGDTGRYMRLFLVSLAEKYSGKFLDHEGSLIRWHWQSGDSK